MALTIQHELVCREVCAFDRRHIASLRAGPILRAHLLFSCRVVHAPHSTMDALSYVLFYPAGLPFTLILNPLGLFHMLISCAKPRSGRALTIRTTLKMSAVSQWCPSVRNENNLFLSSDSSTSSPSETYLFKRCFNVVFSLLDANLRLPLSTARLLFCRAGFWFPFSKTLLLHYPTMFCTCIGRLAPSHNAHLTKHTSSSSGSPISCIRRHPVANGACPSWQYEPNARRP
jgi:hypothetical protein